MYPNEGQVNVDMINEKVQACFGQLLVAKASLKPCDKGNLACFDNDASCLIRRDSGEGLAIRRITQQSKKKTEIYRKNGVYVMPVWVLPRRDRFHRQGK